MPPIVSVCPYVRLFLHSYLLNGMTFDVDSCMSMGHDDMTIARRGLKIKRVGQGYF